ncbi:hypothetical protein DMENIID0001_111790 [Sergentomyia squamirostris]
MSDETNYQIHVTPATPIPYNTNSLSKEDNEYFNNLQLGGTSIQWALNSMKNNAISRTPKRCCFGHVFPT